MSVENKHTAEPESQESDVNFVLPIPPVLSTNKLRLAPFTHAATYFYGIRGHESMFKHVSIALEHPTEFLRFVEGRRWDKGAFLFAVIDTTVTRPDTRYPEWEGSLAGLTGLMGADKTNPVTEISPAIVLPAFQRTHVGSHAVGLLLKYIPELPPSGLGAVCWDDWEESGRVLVERAMRQGWPDIELVLKYKVYQRQFLGTITCTSSWIEEFTDGELENASIPKISISESVKWTVFFSPQLHIGRGRLESLRVRCKLSRWSHLEAPFEQLDHVAR